MIDLDSFSAWNQHHGYEVGDAVLLETGRLLRDRCSVGDFVARLGNDLFGFIVNVKQPDRAANMAERIREAFLLRFGAVQPPVTASIAVVQQPNGVYSGAELYEEALLFLRRAKELGGNRVVTAAHRTGEGGDGSGTLAPRIPKGPLSAGEARRLEDEE